MLHARSTEAWAALLQLLALLLFVGTPGHSAAAAEPLKGVALIIGQSEYKSLAPLPNPVADAKAMEDLLARLGFETDIATDENARKLHRTVDGFIDDAEGADVALLYYSGHAIEAGGVNYLIPVDADLGGLDDADKALVSLQDVLEQLRGKARITILLLDACRSNPFPKDALVRREADAVGQPIVPSGLGAPRGAVAVEASASPDSIGEVIGFAAEPGHAALDGAQGTNSPYAAALLRHLGANAGYDFGQVMTMVTEEVYLATGTRQRPWTNASLRSFLTFGGAADEASPDEALLTGERRKLLLAIAATPKDMRAAVEGLARDQSLPLDPLYGMLKELQVDTSAGPDDLDKQLRTGAENLKKLLAEKVTPLRKDPELVRLAGLADRAQAEGALALAKDYRAKASARADELDKTLDQREAEVDADRIELGGTYADEAKTAVLAFDFQLAAAKYAKAYEQVEGRDDGLAFTYKIGEANALANHGIYRGDKEALTKSLPIFDAAIASADQNGNRDNWAMGQNDLGGAFRALSEHETDTGSLTKAIVSYNSALTVLTREHDQRHWAMIQNNLGNALFDLGRRVTSDENIHEAIKAYEASLAVISREQTPLEWAMVQSNLGNAYYALAEGETETASLVVAIAAYRAVLTAQHRENAPREWAATQNNLGIALQTLGDREKNGGLVNEAVVAFQAALTERTRERVPLDWAATQHNLAIALQVLSEIEKNPDLLRKSVSTFETALAERTHERVPIDWSTTQNNLGEALYHLGKPSGDRVLLARAVKALEAALTERTPERDILKWARTETSLGRAKFLLGLSLQDKATMVEGRQAVEAAWKAYKSAGKNYDEGFRAQLGLYDEFISNMK